MSFFQTPTSFRLNSRAFEVPAFVAQYGLDAGALRHHAVRPPHSSHPDFGHLTMLVMEAVLEVVFVSLPGYLVARGGMFDADSQKLVANLNVTIFLPCLIFTKLAAQLTADKLADLAIIPAIFVAQTVISWGCAWVVAKIMRFEKRPRYFLTAMGVFGNSNSLPISLVISLSKTISGLHWDAIPGDNDDEVASRGILYLLIFQQLGQLVRWTWGYNILLAPREAFEEGTQPEQIEEGNARGSHNVEVIDTQPEEQFQRVQTDSSDLSASGERTPMNYRTRTESASSKAPSEEEEEHEPGPSKTKGSPNGISNGRPHEAHVGDEEEGELTRLLPGPTRTRFARFRQKRNELHERAQARLRTLTQRIRTSIASAYSRLPAGLRAFLGRAAALLTRFAAGVWTFMNPPLWAMLAAILVASIPRLQAAFFTKGTFVANTFTRGIGQTGGVAVPLILVVLGANLARNTVPRPEQTADPAGAREDAAIETRLLVASIISRMVLPITFMAPLLALAAKYLPISILDDPIFVIVCFLLTGAPSALQLAQICQINNVYMSAMARLLFQEYVVWILPSTLVLVMLALEVVEWAHP